MSGSVVGEEVRASVHALRSEVDQETAEDVALAMVAGAAQGFLELAAAHAKDGGRASRLRLLRTLPLAREHMLESVGGLRDS